MKGGPVIVNFSIKKSNAPRNPVDAILEETWAEDRATVETDPSAVPGPEAKFGVDAHTAPPHFQSSATSFLAQSDKLNQEKCL